MTFGEGGRSVNRIESKLKTFLNLYWIRPENALLRVFQSIALDNIKFTSPSLDLSCGDGIFLFTHLGGKLPNNFDVFKITKANKFKHQKFVDIFDYSNNYYVKIVKLPKTKIDYGTDWKENLLKKASKLKLYKKLVLHDNNKLPLPFPSNYFKTIFTNSAYWVKNVENLLNDLHRILKHNGSLILHIITPYLFQTLNNLSFLSKNAIEILDRKRRETMYPLTYKEWLKLFNKCNFKVENAKPIYPNNLIIDIWNIGLRPIAHLITQSVNSLPNEKRTQIKEEWVNIFFELFKPLLYLKQTYTLSNAPCIMFKVMRE
jgi:SAM-dependent methyltransferase